MMAVLLAKKVTSPTISTPQIRFLLPRFLSSTIRSENPDLISPHFKIDEYLISSFGFSPTKAASIAKTIAHLKSPQKPDAVRRFLEQQSFDQAQIKTIILQCPGILRSSVENTIAPNLAAIRGIGLSASALNQIIFSGSVILQLSEAVPRINFWRDFVGGEEADVVRVFKNNRGIISHDTTKGITTKISLLQGHGISFQDIRWIVCKARGFIICSVKLMEDVLNRTKELGFQPQSKMFKWGLITMTSVSREALHKKKNLFKCFGWSENDFFSAVHRLPSILSFSEDNLRDKMEFLLGEANCDISYIVVRPALFSYCLQKRMIPRYNVMRLLESKDNTGKRKDFYASISISEERFVARYILPHKDEIPELREAYLAACAS